MARDDDLDDEERELIRAHRATKGGDDDDEVEYGFGDGSYIRGRYSRVRTAAAARGHKLEADPAGDGDDAGKGGKGQAGGQVKRFTGGRRTG